MIWTVHCVRLATAFTLPIDCPQDMPQLTDADPELVSTTSILVETLTRDFEFFFSSHPPWPDMMFPGFQPPLHEGASDPPDSNHTGDPLVVWRGRCGLLSALGSVAKCQTWPAGLRASGPISRPTPRVDGEASTLAPKPPLAPLRLSSCPQQPALLAPTEPTRAPAHDPGSDPASLRPERQQRPTAVSRSFWRSNPTRHSAPCPATHCLGWSSIATLLSRGSFRASLRSGQASLRPAPCPGWILARPSPPGTPACRDQHDRHFRPSLCFDASPTRLIIAKRWFIHAGLKTAVGVREQHRARQAVCGIERFHVGSPKSRRTASAGLVADGHRGHVPCGFEVGASVLSFPGGHSVRGIASDRPLCSVVARSRVDM